MNSMQGMWQVVNTLQLFYLMQLFSFEYPSNVVFFSKPFDTFTVNLPALASITESSFSKIGLDYNLLDHPPLSEKFEEYDHESTSILVEAADTIFLCCCFILLWLFLSIMKFVSSMCNMEW